MKCRFSRDLFHVRYATFLAEVGRSRLERLESIYDNNNASENVVNAAVSPHL